MVTDPCKKIYCKLYGSEIELACAIDYFQDDVACRPCKDYDSCRIFKEIDNERTKTA
jgi:hypothetical protein